jgi:hypothetical protein
MESKLGVSASVQEAHIYRKIYLNNRKKSAVAQGKPGNKEKKRKNALRRKVKKKTKINCCSEIAISKKKKKKFIFRLSVLVNRVEGASKYASDMKMDWMSDEEDFDDGDQKKFKVLRPLWRSDEVNNLFDELDKFRPPKSTSMRWERVVEYIDEVAPKGVPEYAKQKN